MNSVALPPSPVILSIGSSITSTKKGNKTKKIAEIGGNSYSSANLHRIHDVHIDSTIIPHEGIFSGEMSGAGFEAFERMKLGQVAGWGDHLHNKDKKRGDDFNLDSGQLKKLTQIMDRVRVRKKQDSKMLNLTKAADRRVMRMRLLEELVVTEDEQFRLTRVVDSRCSDPMRFAIIGDEYRLRQELEVGTQKIVNQRETARGGRTLLHEAVGNGHLHIVRMLLGDFKANPNVATLLGWASPLHLAAEKNFRQIAAYLIAFGANMRALDAFGRTPLHMVNSEHMLKLFMKYADRFDPNTKSTEGLLPSQHYAKNCGDDRNPTHELMMSCFEDKTRFERSKELRLEQQAAFDKQQGDVADFPHAISQNSSIPDSKEPDNPHKRTKNLYHYKGGGIK